jgi:hypothetical protein
MNLSDAWTQAGITGTIVFAGGLFYKVYMAINHKRIRCNLCGKEIEASIDVEETTPPRDRFEKNNPLHLVVPCPT